METPPFRVVRQRTAVTVVVVGGSTSRVIIFDLSSGLETPGFPAYSCSVDWQVTGTVRTGTRAGQPGFGDGSRALCSEMFHLSGRDNWLAAEAESPNDKDKQGKHKAQWLQYLSLAS